MACTSAEEMTSSPANRSIAPGLAAAGSTMQQDTEREKKTQSHRGDTGSEIEKEMGRNARGSEL